jgi:signal transduction histidine kinase
MTLSLDDDVFHAVHPFSFVCDGQGRLIIIGRSLKKLFAEMTSGQIVWDFLVIAQAKHGYTPGRIESLQGDLLVLKRLHGDGPQLRGYVVNCKGESQSYLFVLHPAATQSIDVTNLGLDFSDFEIGDSIFDGMLLIRNLEVANRKLRTANQALQHDTKLSSALCGLASVLYRHESEELVYRDCLEMVCRGLGWSLGHVVPFGLTTPEVGTKAVWYSVNPELLERFRGATEQLGVELHQEIPLATQRDNRVSWVSEYKADAGFVRAAALGTEKVYSAVWVPVKNSGGVLAILEFLSDQHPLCTDTYLHFFELLGQQLAQAVQHVQAHLAETQRIAAMAHASKMATLGQIVAGVAHEINNPVSTISLISTILKRSAASGVVTVELVDTQAARLQSCTQRISTIVAELKGFSRDTARDKFKAESLRRIVSETLDLCSVGFDAKRIELVCDDVPADWLVDCRSSQLSQVLLNLLGNAQDAALEGQQQWVRLEVSESEKWYEIRVSDSGRGVPQEIRDKIMTPFFTTKPPGKGTGLGLSISANIMVDHGGELYLDEKVAQTCFAMRLPKAKTADA